jgi:hypothetical protein
VRFAELGQNGCRGTHASKCGPPHFVVRICESG